MVSLQLESKKRISIFLNKDLDLSCETIITENTSYTELLSECKDKLKVKTHKKCVLYDSKGAELSDDDLEYLNENEPLFLSQGEEFSKKSKLLLYNEIKELGSGGFGQVGLYMHKFSHQNVAIKKIQLKSLISPEDINRVFNEIGALRELRHPNIVQLYDSFVLKDEICFVMEYCSGGDLRSYLNKFGMMNSEKLFNIALQIVSGIRYCHNSSIVHRDLKLENLMFSNENYSTIKIVDFGISGMFSQGTGEKSDCGSLLYMPPEYYSSHMNQANPAQDIWALGCIFYNLLCGTHPFINESRKKIIDQIKSLNYKPLPSTVPKLWHKLIKGMLRLKPGKRWDMVRIQEYLEKYYEDPNEEISSGSEEEVKIERKPDKTLTTGKSLNSLQVPTVSIHKSVSPRANRVKEVSFDGKGIRSSLALKNKDFTRK